MNVSHDITTAVTQASERATRDAAMAAFAGAKTCARVDFDANAGLAGPDALAVRLNR